MTATIADEKERSDNSALALVKRHEQDFAAVLPSHIKPATWVRLAQGALKRGRFDPRTNRYELEIAAANNPGQFIATLLDAARQGLEPGTEQFYLTPRRVKGQLEILGIRGYQGEIELIYRAGAVSSVVAEVVREKDHYAYQRGIDRCPIHSYPPFTGEAARGKPIGVYAYAVMKDGAISRVVELGQEDIDRSKKTATGSDSEFSPWQTSEAAMWLKTSIHQLQKWVPTSAEYIREQARAVAVAAGHAQPEQRPAWSVDFDARQVTNVETGEVVDIQPVSVTNHDAESDPQPINDSITDPQVKKLNVSLAGVGITDRAAALIFCEQIINRPISSRKDLTKAECHKLIEHISAMDKVPAGGHSEGG